jgi:excisionase family DNA binding protein
VSNLGVFWSREGPCLFCSSTACHPVSSLEDALPPPSRPSPRPTAPAAGRWPDVLDVHLTAQLLTVSADTVYDLLQRGDLPGRKVGRTWLTTKTAVLQWLEQSAPPRPTAAPETVLARAIAHGDTAALVEAVRTGKARLGTQVQYAARSGHVQGRVPGGPLVWRGGAARGWGCSVVGLWCTHPLAGLATW